MASSFDCLSFDLDDTLYPFNTGIAAACKKNIEDFLIEKCGFPKTQAPILRTELFKTYGSTLAGLHWAMTSKPMITMVSCTGGCRTIGSNKTFSSGASYSPFLKEKSYSQTPI